MFCFGSIWAARCLQVARVSSELMRIYQGRSRLQLTGLILRYFFEFIV